MLKRYTYMLLALVFVLSACAPVAATPEALMQKPTEAMLDKPTEAMMDKPTEAMMDKPTEAMMDKPTEAMMDKPTEAMMDKPTEAMMSPESTVAPEMAEDEMMASPAWFGAMLTDVRTGQNFTINDFKGKVVLVETLAMWCPTCKKQQGQVKALHEALGMDKDLVSIGLDIDPNENAVDLKTYTDNNNFDWIYAVAPVEVTREISNLYGDQFLNPPSTPILIIDRAGQAHPMPFGLKSADDLMKFIEPFLKAEM